MRQQMRLAIVFVAILFVAACAQTGSGLFRTDLNDDIVSKVSAGQSDQDITVLLGKPSQRVRFDNLKSTAWDYLYMDTWGYWVVFSVMMGDDGRVVNKVSRRIDPPDRN